MQGDTGGGVSSYSAIFLKAYQRLHGNVLKQTITNIRRFPGAWRGYFRFSKKPKTILRMRHAVESKISFDQNKKRYYEMDNNNILRQTILLNCSESGVLCKATPVWCLII